ncbi:ABC transporter G family member 23 [Trachymyrmex septentrionalis]|uniref:ABC transporter G family member 23 n=1 Tax=Trachymyrmex septentrionalis TaxID=34720 RepID=A0A195FYL2_9HYME|nr:ABC transporter G family member 23 [Trachymyrmex septentrionalis]
MVQQEAVIVRNAIKRYEKELVFNGLNMTVSRGSIYGLLGASGCGKTTLLSCIVGIRYLDSGEVWVLGGNPGSKGSGIPGPQVGYMPQEISLVGEFTISGALYYFGRINGLNDEEIETRQRFLSELLQLPSANHLVKNMSGDQQRRISLAAAMVHRPELLILDEPTVGLDPILRENIWAYMIQITQEEGITVLITTHYIEETKDANKEYYDNIYEASYAVQNGKLNGLMYFNQNFSEALRIRMEDVTSTKDSDLLASQIQVFLDMGDMLIGLHMQKKLFYSFLEIYENIMKDCKYSPKLADPPIRFEKPVYGTTDLNYADFLAPSFMLILIFCLANTVSTSVIITDRLEGVWNRSIVQGVRTDEILLSHILIQSIIIIIHTAMIMLLYFSIWGLECKGSILDVTILTFLMGFCGLMYGFVISIIWKNYTMANYTSIGSFVILTFLSGCIWPIEGMPKGLRWISYILPTTLPSISMRGIIYKGYSISEEQVYIGFIIVVGWILFYFIVTILGLRRKTW